MYKIIILFLLIPIFAYSAINPNSGLDAGENVKCIATAPAKDLKKIKYGRTEINKAKSNVTGGGYAKINFECPKKICVGIFHPDQGEKNVNQNGLKEVEPRVCCEKIIKGQCSGKEKYDKVADKPMEFVTPCPSANAEDRENEKNSLSRKIAEAAKKRNPTTRSGIMNDLDSITSEFNGSVDTRKPSPPCNENSAGV